MFFPKLKPHRGQFATYVQAKRDGIAIRVHRTQSGWLKAYTRLPTDVTHLVDMDQFHIMQNACLPGEAEVFGELWLPGSPASSVKSDMRACSFDVWGVVADHLDLASPLHDVQAWCDARDLSFSPWFLWESNKSPDVTALPDDVEGWVLKEGDQWYKVKPTPTVDCVVTAVTGGVGKYMGKVGCLHVSVYEPFERLHPDNVPEIIDGYFDNTTGRGWTLKEIARVSGMTDKERSQMGKHSIGRVCEVAYQYVGSRGRLRHPRFIRWRDDKRPEECTHDQLDS